MKDAVSRLASRLGVLEPARRLYRTLRSFEAVSGSQALPPELVRDCRFFASREHMLDALPHGGAVAELGTYRGDFARRIVAQCAPRELHLIDIDYSHFDAAGLTDARVTRHQGRTHEVIATFPDGHFDWVYVDADHSYDGALRDARTAAPKVKPGGYLVFNDFAHIDPYVGRYGVHRAVVDFAIEARWPFHGFAFEPNALYDVALRKPLNPA